jgi:hypothetical protein
MHLNNAIAAAGASARSSKSSWETAKGSLLSAELPPEYEPRPEGSPERVQVRCHDVGRLPIVIGVGK